MRVCEAWQSSLSLQIYRNSQLQMVSLSCPNQFTEKSWLLSIVKKFYKIFAFLLLILLLNFMIPFSLTWIFPLSRSSPKPDGKDSPTTPWSALSLSWNAKVSLWFLILLTPLTITFLLPITAVLTSPDHCLLIGLLTASSKTLTTTFLPTLWNPRYCFLPKKVLLIPYLSVWIPPRFPQILPKIIWNPLSQINSSRIISQQLIRTVNSVCILLPIKPMRKNTNSIGVTKPCPCGLYFRAFHLWNHYHCQSCWFLCRPWYPNGYPSVSSHYGMYLLRW